MPLSSCIAQNSGSNKNGCNCKKLVREYQYFEKVIMVEKYYYFPPKKAVTFYADGTHTNPPINKHIKQMTECIPIELDNPSKDLIYYVGEKKLAEWKEWLRKNCKEEFEYIKKN